MRTPRGTGTAQQDIQMCADPPPLAGLSEFIGKPISLSVEPSANPEQYDIVLL